MSDAEDNAEVEWLYDENGVRYWTDENGNTFFVDESDRIYFVDTNGEKCYVYDEDEEEDMTENVEPGAAPEVPGDDGDADDENDDNDVEDDDVDDDDDQTNQKRSSNSDGCKPPNDGRDSTDDDDDDDDDRKKPDRKPGTASGKDPLTMAAFRASQGIAESSIEAANRQQREQQQREQQEKYEHKYEEKYEHKEIIIISDYEENSSVEILDEQQFQEQKDKEIAAMTAAVVSARLDNLYNTLIDQGIGEINVALADLECNDIILHGQMFPLFVGRPAHLRHMWQDSKALETTRLIVLISRVADFLRLWVATSIKFSPKFLSVSRFKRVKKMDKCLSVDHKLSFVGVSPDEHAFKCLLVFLKDAVDYKNRRINHHGLNEPQLEFDAVRLTKLLFTIPARALKPGKAVSAFKYIQSHKDEYERIRDMVALYLAMLMQKLISFSKAQLQEAKQQPRHWQEKYQTTLFDFNHASKYSFEYACNVVGRLLHFILNGKIHSHLSWLLSGCEPIASEFFVEYSSLVKMYPANLNVIKFQLATNRLFLGDMCALGRKDSDFNWGNYAVSMAKVLYDNIMPDCDEGSCMDFWRQKAQQQKLVARRPSVHSDDMPPHKKQRPLS